MRLLSLFVLLLAVHALCDFPLQGDFLARVKSHLHPIPGIPWQWALFWHAFLHAAGVTLLTGNILAGALELVTHASIDYWRSAGRLSFNVDQWLHVAVKLVIVQLRYLGAI